MTKTEDDQVPMPTCGTCRFSLPARGPGGEIDFKSRFCRKNPPTPIIAPGPQGAILRNIWPTMGTADACFSHEFAENAVLLPGEKRPAAQKPS